VSLTPSRSVLSVTKLQVPESSSLGLYRSRRTFSKSVRQARRSWMDFSSAPAKEEPRKSPKSLPIRDDRQPSRALPREREREASRARTDPPCLGALISDTRYRETSRPKGEKTVAAWTVLVTMPARCPPPLPLHGSSTHGPGPNNASCSGF